MTGVLPIALSRACKLSGFFMQKDKVYVGIMHLHKEMKLKQIQEIIDKEFTGKIKQTPPKRSKVKRQEREREIKKFELLEKNGKDVLFLAEVQAGTYIRKLISDLGDKIGGAHMTELRRTRAGFFNEQDENFINLYKLKEAVDGYNNGDESELRKILIPAEQAIKKIMPVVQVKDEKIIKQLLTGKPIHKKDINKFSDFQDNDIFSVFSGERFIEIAKKADEQEKDNEIIAKPLFVLN